MKVESPPAIKMFLMNDDYNNDTLKARASDSHLPLQGGDTQVCLKTNNDEETSYRSPARMHELDDHSGRIT